MHSLIIELIFFVLSLHSTFRGCVSEASKPSIARKASSGHQSSAVYFPVIGNVYPKGYYHLTMNIGNPPKPYLLDIDTGSDLTWLQCDAPCMKCFPSPHPIYKPNKDLVACMDPLCASVHWPETHPCESQTDQCDYDIQYADQASSVGVLTRDFFSLKFVNGSVARTRLGFGCGYEQESPHSGSLPFVDGVLGLGVGKVGIIHQLQNLGVTRAIVGHCLSSKGDGYLFFGDELIPSSGVTWTPMSTTEVEKHYSLGTAELYWGSKTTGKKGLLILFDSGSTYTYLTGEAYKALFTMLTNDIKGKPLQIANEDKSLPVCWKGSKRFKSVNDVKNLFQPVILSFKNSKNTRFQMDPESYLIINENGNACLGILDGAEVGLENMNLIGDISFQNKMIIYDNEKQQIGWAAANCDRLPNIDEDGDDSIGGLCKPYGSNFGSLPVYCSAN